MQEEAASHKVSVRVMDIGNKQQDANACDDLSFELVSKLRSFHELVHKRVNDHSAFLRTPVPIGVPQY